ncbi:Lin1244/Lin1753 domain-containing protein [Gracilimonas sp.]|uniref:Lin1244/Lin1753 domain-containing protein n=1 Tax=Gracilimonas sp. TaxID=1974203 RepID=UPI003BA8E97A
MSKPNIKDAYYFSHDVNARRDPKIMALIEDRGIEGYGRFFILIELLAEAPEYKYPKKGWAYQALAQELRTTPDESKKLIEALISDYELLKDDDSEFWSESLLRRMKIKEEKRQKKVKAGKAGAEARWKDKP